MNEQKENKIQRVTEGIGMGTPSLKVKLANEDRT